MFQIIAVSDTASSSRPSDNQSISLEEANSIVLLLDSDGKIRFINSFGLDFFGFSESELIGSPSVGTIIPPKDSMGNDLASMIDGFLLQPDDYIHQIHENRKKNGEPVWVIWSNRAFRDANGQIDHILCVGNDITDRKALETILEETRNRLKVEVQEQCKCLQETNERLRKEVAARKKVQQDLAESRNRYRLYSEASTEGILFHVEGIAIDVNEAFANLVECPRDLIIGMSIIDHFVSPEDIQRTKQKMASNDYRIFEITARTATGRTFPVELRAKAGKLGGRPCRVVTVRDISNRKKTERQLIQSQKMEAIGTLAGGIAHDFNNMLAGIQGNVEIVRHQLSPESPHQKRLAAIDQIVERGAKLSGQLLGYARGGQNEIRRIKLDQLVGDVLEMFGHGHRLVSIHTSFDIDTPVIKGDRNQIEQVLLNLIINAVHAMPGGGKLHIETAATILSNDENRPYETIPGVYAMLTVRDTGHGMDTSILKKIFEPFFTTKEEGQGTGLGLASAYGIIKNHRGYIDVFSEPGQGTQFNVLLPSLDHEKPSAAMAAISTKKNKETILVMDSQADYLEMGREMLVLMGYTVITAKTYDEAMDRCKKHSNAIKLAILDLPQPVLKAKNDLDDDRTPCVKTAIHQIKKYAPGIHILVSSNHLLGTDKARSLKKNCSGFIQKPFHLASLYKKIKELK